MAALEQSPLVVGTVRPQGLAALAASPAEERAPDLIEARFDLAREAGDVAAPDGLPDLEPYFSSCRQLEETGSPVLATIRLIADGGRWPVDAERLSWFEQALSAGACSWIDIEVESEIAPEVVRRAHDLGRRVIVSHHDFNRTPAVADLEAIIDRARAQGADVVKIATRVEGLEDHDRLIDLLRLRRGEALAIIGMGAFGTPLRSYLPAVGSRLTYGYLDEHAAPGQLPARELVERLLLDCPRYLEHRRTKSRANLPGER